MLPIKHLGNFYTNDTLKEALIGFLFGQNSGHLWFLSALFWCIIIFCSIAKLLKKFNIQSIYAILLIAGAIQFYVAYLSIDLLGFKTGLRYMFYFALGFVFESERNSNQKWNIKKTIFTLMILVVLEILNKKFNLLDSFFTIIIGSFFTYILSDLFDRIFINMGENKVWKFLVKNIFHDLLEYIVLRMFVGNNLLSSSLRCYLYTFCRIVFIFVVSLLLGDVVGKIKGILNRILSDRLVNVKV